MINRWIVLAAAVVIQTVLGGIYAWSTFVPSLMKEYGLNNAQSGFIFGLTVAVFTLSMTIAGRLLKRKGPRFTSTAAAFLYLSGYLIASVSNGNFSVLLISLGIISGSGIGFGYVGPLSVGMKWFPEKKGLITGIAVAGFGGGAVILSTAARYFIDSGMDVLVFFRWMGIVLGLVLFLSARFMANPPRDIETSTSSSRITGKLRSGEFALLTFGLFSGTFAGLMVIGNLVQIVSKAGLTGALSAAAVSTFAVGNALGRILWGHLFDHFLYKSIPASLASLAAVLTLFLLPLPGWTLLIISGCIGFGFGASFVVYASAISHHFGVESFATLYPVCFLAYGAAGIIGPAVGGRLADNTGSFDAALYVSIAMLIFAVIITSLGLRRLDFGKLTDKIETVT